MLSSKSKVICAARIRRVPEATFGLAMRGIVGDWLLVNFIFYFVSFLHSYSSIEEQEYRLRFRKNDWNDIDIHQRLSLKEDHCPVSQI